MDRCLFTSSRTSKKNSPSIPSQANLYLVLNNYFDFISGHVSANTHRDKMVSDAHLELD